MKGDAGGGLLGPDCWKRSLQQCLCICPAHRWGRLRPGVPPRILEELRSREDPGAQLEALWLLRWGGKHTFGIFALRRWGVWACLFLGVRPSIWRPLNAALQPWILGSQSFPSTSPPPKLPDFFGVPPVRTSAILDPGVLGTSTLFSCGLYFPTAWPPQISGIWELLRSITWGPRPYWLDCL